MQNKSPQWVYVITMLAITATMAHAGDSTTDVFFAGKIGVVKHVDGKPLLFKAKSEKLDGLALPASVTGGTLEVFDTSVPGAGSAEFPLNAGTWKALGNPAGSKGFKYKGSGTDADPCKKVSITPKGIKMVCKGEAELAPPFTDTLGIVLTLNTHRYCAEFGGTTLRNDAKILKRKNSSAPAECPSTESVVADLDGLRWELPCTSPPNGAVCTTNNNFQTSAMLTGSPGSQYEVTLRFRGVVEQKSYTGGVVDGMFLTGGTPAADAYNVYRLQVSDPAAVYYLNAGVSNQSRSYLLDETEVVPMNAGATVTLTGEAIDGNEIINTDGTNPIIPADVPPAPDPFNGQFIQMDVIDITELP